MWPTKYDIAMDDMSAPKNTGSYITEWRAQVRDVDNVATIDHTVELASLSL